MRVHKGSQCDPFTVCTSEVVSKKLCNVSSVLLLEKRMRRSDGERNAVGGSTGGRESGRHSVTWEVMDAVNMSYCH